MVTLRPQTLEDLPLLVVADARYDDFGPRSRSAPLPPEVDAPGGLTVLDDEGRVAGSVSWAWRQWGPNAGSRSVVIGIALRPEHRGRGVGSQAQRQLIDLLFRHAPVHRVEAVTDVDNVAEQRALERAGLRREAVVRGAQWRDGAYRDCLLYAVLRTDSR